MEWISPLAHLLTKTYSIGVRTPVYTPGKSTTDLQGMYIYVACVQSHDIPYVIMSWDCTKAIYTVLIGSNY